MKKLAIEHAATDQARPNDVPHPDAGMEKGDVMKYRTSAASSPV
jgi:hypothetical protein